MRGGLGLNIPDLARQVRGVTGFDFTGAALPAGATLARGSTATRINASGVLESVATNGARFDHDATTLALRGLLIEPAATNLLTYSADFSQGVWSRTGMTATPNDRAAPDGTTTATRIDATTTGRLQRFGDGSVGALHTSSLWIYSATAQSINFGFYDGGSFTQSFAIPANRWTRVQLSRNYSSTDRRLWILENGVAYTIWIWGWQLETGSAASSHVATTTAQASRAADILTLDWGAKGVTDGTITVRYTFDDGSSQDVATTVSGGTATVPTTLNRPRIRQARRV